MYHHDTMKQLLKLIFAIESVLLRKLLTEYFANNNLPEQRVKVFLYKKELTKIPDDNLHNFKRSNIECYMERLSATLFNGKYHVLNDFCDIELLAYYSLEKK